MSDLYTIEKQTLTDIGDALRLRWGETKMIDVEPTVLDVIVSKTDNATGFDSISGSSEKTSPGYFVLKANGATKIKLKIGYALYYTSTAEGWCDVIKIAKGEYTSSTFPSAAPDVLLSPWAQKKSIPWTVEEYTFDDTDAITLYWDGGWNTNTSGYYAEATIIQARKEVKNAYSSAEMAAAINNLPPSIPAEGLIITGDASHMFLNGRLDWYLKTFGDLITTKDITGFSNMFYGSTIDRIPFKIVGKKNYSTSCDSLFRECKNLKEVPQMADIRPSSMSYLFSYNWNLREIPDDFVDMLDWSYMETNTASYYGGASNMFYYCCSLRYVPMNLFERLSAATSYSGSYFYSGFCQCFSLDGVADMPIPYNTAWTSNAFSSTFTNCYRLKDITFKMPDGQPYVKQWKSQMIDLTANVGYSMGADYSNSYILRYNSGITKDKCVSDDATYQALKDDPDWYTNSITYSRYNHDSAVATINSLPDTSAYLTSTGGTNTIKFKGAAGSLTDGGAINTMTAEEIAVATAKGWTVSFA